MEEPFEEFLAKVDRSSPDAFAKANPHAFLFREVLVGEGTRKLDAAEIESRTRRFEKLVGRHAGYALMQQGHRELEKLLKEATVAGERQLEARLIRLRGSSPGPVTIGSGGDANVKLGAKGIGPIAIAVEPTADGFDFEISVRDGEVWYDSQRLEAPTRVRLEDGLQLQLGSEATFQTFTPLGFAHFLGFKARIKQAKGA